MEHGTWRPHTAAVQADMPDSIQLLLETQACHSIMDVVAHANRGMVQEEMAPGDTTQLHSRQTCLTVLSPRWGC